MWPILGRWGPFTFYAYGAVLACAIFIAIRWVSRRAGEVGASRGQITDVCLVGVVGGLVGARTVYVAQHWAQYAAAPWEIVRLDHGGLVFYGGLLGGLSAALWMLRRSRLPVARTLDIVLPAVALAQGIGRVGCFLNGCCYGLPTTLPWGVWFPGESFARHPTQLYESLALLGLSVFLGWGSRRPWATGTVTAAYLIGYGIWRAGVECLRADAPPVLGVLTFSQGASIVLVVMGMWVWRRRGRGAFQRA